MVDISGSRKSTIFQEPKVKEKKEASWIVNDLRKSISQFSDSEFGTQKSSFQENFSSKAERLTISL